MVANPVCLASSVLPPLRSIVRGLPGHCSLLVITGPLLRMALVLPGTITLPRVALSPALVAAAAVASHGSALFLER